MFVIIPCIGKAAGFCFGLPAAALLCLIFNDFWLWYGMSSNYHSRLSVALM
jgi:hypothetical protein